MEINIAENITLTHTFFHGALKQGEKVVFHQKCA